MSHTNQEKTYYYSLDMLRFFVIFGVVLFHIHTSFEDPFLTVLGKIYKWGGGIGNIFFFMSSGLLTMRSFDNNPPISFKEFFLTKLKAIYPLFFISNIVQIILSVIRNGVTALDLSRVLLSLLFVSEGWVSTIQPYNFPTWFVCVLFLCYIQFYIIWRGTNNNEGFIAAITAMLLLGYICRSGKLEFPFFYSVTGVGEMNFFAGVILYLILSVNAKIRKITGTLLFLATSIVVLLSLRYGFSNVTSDTGIILSFIIMPTILFVCVKMKKVNELLNAPLVSHLGKISMHIFFWHFPVLTLFFGIIKYCNIRCSMSNQMLFLTYILLLLIVAELSKLLDNMLRKTVNETKENMA